MTLRLRSALQAGFVLVLCATIARAQGRPLRLYVFATDASGVPVYDLSADDFLVRERGVGARVLSARRGTDPIRLLIVSNVQDSSETGAVKRGLKQMLADLPASTEVAVATADHGYASRLAPTTDRQRQLSAVDSLRDDGGELAHAMMEADDKLFRGQPARWPIYVLVTDDNGENASAVKQVEFDAFADRLTASATVYAVLTKEGHNSQTGKIVDALTRNLTDSTHGAYLEVSSGRGLAEAIAALGPRIRADAQRMADGYELVYEGRAAVPAQDLEIGTARPGVTLTPSLVRVLAR